MRKNLPNNQKLLLLNLRGCFDLNIIRILKTGLLLGASYAGLI